VSHDESALVERRPVFEGRIVRLSVDTVRFPDGSTSELELIRHPGAACVLPFLGDLSDPDPDVLLIHQYRYAGGGFMYEVPAGMPQGPDESWDECARRELEEETGYRAGTLHPLTHIYTTPGFTDEVIHLYAATDLTKGAVNRDTDEFMEVRRMPISRALGLIREGELVDAKSIACILLARSFLMRRS
jgi:ADP-ribose pyrophosphatase